MLGLVRFRIFLLTWTSSVTLLLKSAMRSSVKLSSFEIQDKPKHRSLSPYLIIAMFLHIVLPSLIFFRPPLLRESLFSVTWSPVFLMVVSEDIHESSANFISHTLSMRGNPTMCRKVGCDKKNYKTYLCRTQ